MRFLTESERDSIKHTKAVMEALREQNEREMERAVKMLGSPVGGIIGTRGGDVFIYDSETREYRELREYSGRKKI
jgi:LmbE family N-acetylglucosaminyl deacetylase